MTVQVELEATEGATNFVAFLPKLVTGMTLMLALKRAVKTWAVEIVVECLLVDSFVYTGAAFGALQVAFGLFKAVLVSGLILSCLGL